MDALMKLSREVQIVLGGAVLYVIFSFLDWQQVSFGGISAGLNEWHGIGVVAALLARRSPGVGDRTGDRVQGRARVAHTGLVSAVSRSCSSSSR